MSPITSKDSIRAAYRRVLALGATHDEAVRSVATALATDELVVAAVIAEPAEAAHA